MKRSHFYQNRSQWKFTNIVGLRVKQNILEICDFVVSDSSFNHKETPEIFLCLYRHSPHFELVSQFMSLSYTAHPAKKDLNKKLIPKQKTILNFNIDALGFKDPVRVYSSLKISCQMTDWLRLPVYFEPRSWFANNITLSFCNFNFQLAQVAEQLLVIKVSCNLYQF